MQGFTGLLSPAGSSGLHGAADLLPLVYDELRRVAAKALAGEKAGQTLDATALVHEAYLRLLGDARARQWDSKWQFFAAAAEAMRRILVDNARRRLTVKHGGGRKRVAADLNAATAHVSSVDILALNEVLDRLAECAPERAQLVKLRFFAGLTMPEAAQALGISLATAERYWTFARTWLYAELSDPPSGDQLAGGVEGPQTKPGEVEGNGRAFSP